MNDEMEQSHERLRKALIALVKKNEDYNEAMTRVLGKTINWNTDCLKEAKEALEADANVHRT